MKKGFTPLEKNRMNHIVDKKRPYFLTGFTLIEVIVALGIFGLGVLALLGYFAISTQFVRFARQTTIASNLAQQVLEESLEKPYESLTPGAGSKAPFSADPENPYHLYQNQTNISLIDSNLAPSGSDVGLKKIDVFVYWVGVSGETNVHLSTVVSSK